MISVVAAAGETVFAEYELEYGKDRIEMHVGAVKPGQKVLLVDDLIATGGTMGAGIQLMRQVSSRKSFVELHLSGSSPLAHL